jgi:hypothetical protein
MLQFRSAQLVMLWECSGKGSEGSKEHKRDGASERMAWYFAVEINHFT